MLKPGQKSAFYGEKGMRLVRSWKILLMLAESPEPLTVPVIHRRIHQDPDFINNECSLQTIREDLKTLHKANFPVEMINLQGETLPSDAENSGRGLHKNTRWRLSDPTQIGNFENPRHLMPTAGDVLNISLCRSLLTMEVPGRYPLFPVLEKMLAELHCRMNQMLRRGEPAVQDLVPKILHLGKRHLSSAAEQANWNILARAIGKAEVLQGQYQNRNESSAKTIDIAPLALWIDEGRSYVLGAGGTDHRIRAWRVDRFADLRVLNGVTAPKVPDEDIEKKLRESFRGYIAEPVEICLEVQPEIAYLFREYSYHPTQTLREVSDGGLEVRLHCSLNWGIEEWILGFGEYVKVTSPPELRIKIASRLKALMESYQDCL